MLAVPSDKNEIARKSARKETDIEFLCKPSSS